MQTTVRLQHEAFDVAAETAAMTCGRTDIGALVTFAGICRGAESGEPTPAQSARKMRSLPPAPISAPSRVGSAS